MFSSYIDICGEINERLSERVCRQIEELSKYSEPIVLFIDTEGGFVIDLQKIVNKMINSGIPFYAYVIGKAYSAGFILTLFCEKVFCLPQASLMFHAPAYTDPLIEFISFSFGERPVSETEFDFNCYRILARKLGSTFEDVKIMAREEKVWTVLQALHAGIIDIIISD